MTPIDVLAQVVAGLVLGGLAGTVFFVGLAWTVGRMTSAAAPAAVVAGSLALRLAIVFGSLLIAVRAGPVALAAGVLGLLVARRVVVRRVTVRARTGGG